MSLGISKRASRAIDFIVLAYPNRMHEWELLATIDELHVRMGPDEKTGGARFFCAIDLTKGDYACQLEKARRKADEAVHVPSCETIPDVDVVETGAVTVRSTRRSSSPSKKSKPASSKRSSSPRTTTTSRTPSPKRDQ